MNVVLFLMPIVLGFVIGWFTNYLAVKMLFRPYQPRRVFGFTVQGIFPRLQPELADQAGELVERELFQADVVRAHLARESTQESLRKAVLPAIGQALVTPLGPPRQWLNDWGGELGSDADALLKPAAAQIANGLVTQFNSPGGRDTLVGLVAGQIETALERPIGDWLTELAPPQPAGAAKGDTAKLGGRVAALRRLLRLPALSDWLANGDLPRQLADAVGDAIGELLRATPTLGTLVPDDARGGLLTFARKTVPKLQQALSAGLAAGPLRDHVIREATAALRGNLERRIEPGTLLARFLSPERLVSLAEGVIEKLPDQVSGIVAAPGTTRALDDLVTKLLDDLLAASPDIVHQQLRNALEKANSAKEAGATGGRWMVDRMRELVASAPLQNRVASAVDSQLADWLDEPTGQLLARLRGEQDGTARELAGRIVDRIDWDAIQPELQRLSEDQLRALLDRPLPPIGELLHAVAAHAPGGNASATNTNDAPDPVIQMADNLADRLIALAIDRVQEALPALDIHGLVRETISAWPPQQLEQAINDVAATHLKFVTWVGGLLGAMIGSLQLLFSRLN